MAAEKRLIFDLEIVKAIPAKGEPRLEGIEYCGGWGDHAGMGISVGAFCVLDLDSGRISDSVAFVGGEGLEQVLELSRYPVGGFNSKKFDDALMAATFPSFERRSDFDIFELCLERAGQLGRQYWRDGLKYNLDVISKVNGYAKTLSGELAPIEWQRGERQKVIDYCCHDVQIEALTLLKLERGELIDPNTGQVFGG